MKKTLTKRLSVVPGSVELLLGLALVCGLSLALGGLAVSHPGPSFILCGLVGLAVLVTYGSQPTLLAVIAIFPMIPSDLRLAGSSTLVPYPQRIVVAVVICVAIARSRDWSARAWRLRALRQPIRWFALFIAVGLVSATVSPVAETAWLGVMFYGVQLGGGMLAACLLASGHYRERYLRAIAVGALGVALISALQYLMPHSALENVLGPVFTETHTGGDMVRALPLRVSGPLPYPVSLGAYSVFTLPFVLRGAISPDRRTALLGRMASVAVLGTVMLSQTRMAMLAVPFVVVTLLGVRHRQAADGARGMATGITTSERRRPRRVVIAVALVAVLGMVGLFGASTLNSQGEILGAAIAYKGQGNGANARSQSVAGRTSLYLTAWHALLARPLVGYGMRVPTQDAQNSVFRHYGQSYAFESYDVVLPLEVGAVGLLAAIVTVIALVRVVRRRIRSTIDRATVYAALIAGLVMAIGSNPFDIEVTYLWMVLGLWIGACLERAPNSAVADEPSYRAAWRQR